MDSKGRSVLGSKVVKRVRIIWNFKSVRPECEDRLFQAMLGMFNVVWSGTSQAGKITPVTERCQVAQY